MLSEITSKGVQMRRLGYLLVIASVAALVSPVAPATAGHDNDPRTKNLHPMGHIEEPASLLNADVGNPDVHTDIAFWGSYAFQGSWLGFNIRDISAPGNPKHVSYTSCAGNQGDVVVWGDILVRSWNTPAGTPGLFGAGTTCDGHDVPIGFEGLHIFDVSDVTDPELIGSVDLSATALPATPDRPARCGSHTATGVPDLANNRLLIYNSGAGCAGIDIVEIPLSDPASASFLRWEAADDPAVGFGRDCHDTGVILGDALWAACAGDDGYTLWSLGGASGGSLEDPLFMYSRTVPGVSIGHAASFSWDGEVLVFEHEPGGGVGPACEADDPDSDKSLFFFETTSGDLLGTWVLPRAQSSTENCSIHNFNIVPLRSGRDVVVAGNYQAGTWVVDFTDPSNPVTVAWSDPPAAPVPPPPGDFLGLDIVGAWSSYWYNGFIYETNIGEGLNIFRLSGNVTAGAIRLDHLNPVTQEFTIP
jgi:hypothetical protein